MTVAPNRLIAIALKKRDDILTKKSLEPSMQEFIDRSYSEGGKPFVESIKKYGCNERGDEVTLEPWYCELLELIGDFRIKATYTSGCAQLGKSLSHTLLLCHCLTEGGLNTLWSYDTERSLNIQVPSNFRPVISGWLDSKGIAKKRGDGSETNILYQINDATAQFVYVSNTATAGKSRQGLATASGTNVGVSRDIVFNEEKSQSRPGTRDPLLRRMDAGRLPSRPVRDIGTPGSGLGIERDIESADYQFYPHFQCEGCDRVQPLDPKGCLLKEIEQATVTGEVQKTHLSVAGRPIDWHHSNPKDAVQSAYFGCAYCGHRILDEQRSQSWYQCRSSGIRLRDFLDGLEPGVQAREISAGIEISPLLRVEAVNTAVAIVKEGLETRNADDWQQQRLGHPSISTGDGLTLKVLTRAIGAPIPTRKPDTTIGGIDQGRREHWLWINDIYLPENYQSLTHEQSFEQAIRVCRFAGDLESGQILDVIEAHKVKFGITDNEPDIDWAGGFCKRSRWQMADQRDQMDAVISSEVFTGGEKFECWKIRNSKFLKSVRDLFLSVATDSQPLMRLPDDWDKWLGRLKDDRNPIKHLLSPTYDAATGKWIRADDHIDDLYYAAMFAEVGFYLWLQTHKNRYRSGSLGLTRKQR